MMLVVAPARNRTRYLYPGEGLGSIVQKLLRPLTSAVGIPCRKPSHTGEKRRKPDASRGIGDGFTIGCAENHGVQTGTTDERFAAITGRPQVDVVAGPAEHDVAVRWTSGRRTAIGSTENDVAPGTTVHDIVAIQAEHHVIVRPALEHVSPVQRLVGTGAGLDRRVVLPVIVQPNQELRSFAAFYERCLRGLRRAEKSAHQTEQYAAESTTTRIRI